VKANKFILPMRWDGTVDDYSHRPRADMKDKVICYCIGVKEKTIVKAIREGAHTLKAIQKATQACTGDRCRELNPKGRCCSGDILALIKNTTGKKAKAKGCCCH
jgi:NAD(P)H-nitrite reductase large subunit